LFLSCVLNELSMEGRKGVSYQTIDQLNTLFE